MRFCLSPLEGIGARRPGGRRDPCKSEDLTSAKFFIPRVFSDLQGGTFFNLTQALRYAPALCEKTGTSSVSLNLEGAAFEFPPRAGES